MLMILALTILTSLVLSLVTTPLVRFGFRALGIVDKPDLVRKLQKSPVSLGGGLAVFVAVCATFAGILLFDRRLGDGILGVLDSRWHGLFFAAAALMMVGLLDDILTLRGRQKLVLQFLIVVSVVGGGTIVQTIGFFGVAVDLGVFAYPITVIWLLAAINALNLIDGADGMASTAGAVISGGLAVLCFCVSSTLGSVVAAALCGALLGFLVFNRPPASIYLGDSGSMVIGLLVGVIAIWGSVKGTTLLSVAPLLVLSLPLFDSLIAILRRVLTGRSIYATDRAHLHHRLLDRFSHRSMLLVVAGLCGLTSITSVLSAMFNQQWIAFAGVAVVVAILVFSRLFGGAELNMLARRGSNFFDSLMVRANRSETHVHQKSMHLQGKRQWELIWNSLVEFAISRQLACIKLDVSISWMQEGYHGSWRRSRQPDKASQLVMKLPIFIGENLVARLEVIGNAKSEYILETLDLLHDRLGELRFQINHLIETDAAALSPLDSGVSETSVRALTAEQDIASERKKSSLPVPG